MKISCPKCGLSYEETVLTCSCGQSLEEIKKIVKNNSILNPMLAIIRYILFIIGLLGGSVFIIGLTVALINGQFLSKILELILLLFSAFILVGLSTAIGIIIKNENDIKYLKDKIFKLEQKSDN